MRPRPMILSALFLLIFIVLVTAPVAHAQKFLSGTISTDTTLDTVGGAVYQVNGNVTVNAGVTLTIDPGVVLKFYQDRYLTVYGTLMAEGGPAAANTIVFTSIKDDDAPLGAGEDTNADGGATSPAPGDWHYLYFRDGSSSGSSLRYCTVRYGGAYNNTMLATATGAAPTFRDCDLTYSYRGLGISAPSSPSVINCSFNQMTRSPVAMELGSSPNFSNIIFDNPSGNLYDTIEITDGSFNGSATISAAPATVGGVATHCLAYFVIDNIDIDAGEDLTIEPGVVLKFNPNIHVTCNGLLAAAGTAGNTGAIYFTSIDDDNAPAPNGQDTNTNGNNTFPDQNDWGGIRFNDSADDNSILRYCQVLFAGYNGANYGAVTCTDASPNLVNCDLTSAFYGIKCLGVSNPFLSNTSVNAMQDVPIALEISSDPVFDNVVFESTSDNGFDAIGILGGTLNGSNTLRIRGALLGPTPIDNLVYIQLSDITVAETGALTIQPGIVVKPRANVDIWVDGALVMDGTADPDSTIVFTSYKDDNYGTPDDTNNDGSMTSPDKQDWGRIQYRDGSTGSVSHAVLRFGGAGTRAILAAESASPNWHDLVISDAPYGLEQSGTAASVINNVDIANTTYTPVRYSISADPLDTNITFTNVGLRAIGLIPETVGVDSVLRIRSLGGFDGITYYLNGRLTVAEGAHFRIEPGVTTKVAQGSYGHDLAIDGSLWAVGTPDSLIAFTGIQDDSRGNPGDTADDGANAPAARQWGGIHFFSTSIDAQSRLELCEFAYGGYAYYTEGPAAVWCNSAAPIIINNSFETNNIGVWTDGNSNPLIQDNSFFNQTSVCLATSVLADPTYVGNTFNQNGIHAVGLIDETLSADATLEKISMAGLDPYPYYNLGTTTVGVGTTLTIDPGVLIKVRANSDVIVVNGALHATGTTGETIVMTSIRDDSQGGDSNVDGSASSPSAGDWYGIHINDSSDDGLTQIINCLFRFGGSDFILDLDSCSPSIVNNQFELCTFGIRVRNDSSPNIINNAFQVISWYPIEKSILATPNFMGNTLSNVNIPAIAIRGESIGQDMTMTQWDFAGYTNITQVLTAGTLTVQLGATLTIEPGIVLKMLSQSYQPFANYIYVYGALVADADGADPIIFTSVKDDTVGNPADTNSDGSATTPARGNWNSMYFDEVSDDTVCLLRNCELRYGRSTTTNYGMVYTASASPTFIDCLFDFAGHGLGAYGASAPVMTNCTFDNMSSTPVIMSLISDPIFTGCTFTSGNSYNALGIFGETLAQDVTIRRRDVAQVANIPYVLLGHVVAGYSSVLSVEPGVIIKGSGSNITIRRGLMAEGGVDQDDQIVFTSVTDDFYGGDTNNDGSATAPGQTRWGRIIIENEAIDDSTRVSNAVFRYGYHNPSYPTITVISANPKFDNCLFAYNGTAIEYQGTAGDPSEGWIHDSDFLNNTYYAVRNTGTAFTVDATNNWWGHASGPLDDSDDTGSGGFYNPGGLGDPVGDRVDYGSWKTVGISNVLMGDVSRNGDIRAYDASLVLQELVGPGLLGPLQLVLGDVDCNASLQSLDAALILRYVAGLDTYFPCTLDSTVTKGYRLTDEPYAGSESITFDLALPEVQLSGGESAWVPIELAGSGELYGQQYHITFDPDQVTVKSVQLLPNAEGAMLAWNIHNGNELRIALANMLPVNVFDSVQFELEAVEDLPSATDISLDLTYAVLNSEVYGALSGSDDTPEVLSAQLFQNQPNPFNPSTTIKYHLPPASGEQRVELKVFDTRGHVVRTLVNEVQQPGPQQVIWNGRDHLGHQVSSGVYLYRLDVGGKPIIRKMVLLK